jgi:hypothetical protein
MAKGPGTKGTVGKVGVKVVPDTTKFPEELKAKLEKLERDLKIEVPVDIDTREASAQYKALKERLEAQKINAKVDIDKSSIGRVTKSLASISKSARDTNVFSGISNSLRSAGQSAERAAEAVVRMRQAMAANVAQTARWAAQILRSTISVDKAKTAWTAIRLAVIRVGDAVSKIPRLAALAKDLALTGRVAGMLAVDKVKEFGKALVTASTYTERFKTAMTGVAVYSIKATDSVKNLGNRIRSISWKDVTNGARRAGSAVGRFGKSLSANVGKGFDKTIRSVGKGISSAFSGMAGIVDKVGGAIGGAVGQLGELGRTGWIVVAVFAILAPLVGLVAGLIAGLPLPRWGPRSTSSRPSSPTRSRRA